MPTVVKGWALQYFCSVYTFNKTPITSIYKFHGLIFLKEKHCLLWESNCTILCNLDEFHSSQYNQAYPIVKTEKILNNKTKNQLILSFVVIMMCHFEADNGLLDSILSTKYISSHWNFIKFIRRWCVLQCFSNVPTEPIYQHYVVSRKCIHFWKESRENSKDILAARILGFLLASNCCML